MGILSHYCICLFMGLFVSFGDRLQSSAAVWYLAWKSLPQMLVMNSSYGSGLYEALWGAQGNSWGNHRLEVRQEAPLELCWGKNALEDLDELCSLY